MEKKSLIANRNAVTKAIIASTPTGNVSAVAPKTAAKKAATRAMAKNAPKATSKSAPKATSKSAPKATSKATAKNALRQMF